MEILPQMISHSQTLLDSSTPSIISLMHSLDENLLCDVGRYPPTGIIKRVKDEDLNSATIEITGSNCQNNYFFIPKMATSILSANQNFKHLILFLKPVSKYFSFEFSILDQHNSVKIIRMSSQVNIPKINGDTYVTPLKMEIGWNKISLDLSELCKKCFKCNFKQMARFQINANFRIRRIFLAEENYNDEKLAKFPQIWVNSKFKIVDWTENSNENIKKVSETKKIRDIFADEFILKNKSKNERIIVQKFENSFQNFRLVEVSQKINELQNNLNTSSKLTEENVNSNI